MKDYNLIPIWEHKRYSLGYFIEGLQDIWMYLLFSIHTNYFGEGLLGIWTILITMIKGEALKYRWEDEK